MVALLRKHLFVFLLGIMMLLSFTPFNFFGGSIEPSYAAATNVYLKDGEVYDISKAGKNTIVNIDDSTAKSGKNDRAAVTLKGSSTYVWIHISVSKGKTVEVNLADGLNIQPGSDSAYGTGGYFDTRGWSQSGIYIVEIRPEQCRRSL